MSDTEHLPRPSAGQVWKPARGGMWKTVEAVRPAGIEWSTRRPEMHAFTTWEAWNKWVRDFVASPSP